MTSFHHTPRRGSLAALVAAALMLAACSAPGGGSGSAASDTAAGGEKCADSDAVALQDKLKGLSPADRDKTLLAQAKQTNDGTINLYGEVNDPNDPHRSIRKQVRRPPRQRLSGGQ